MQVNVFQNPYCVIERKPEDKIHRNKPPPIISLLKYENLVLKDSKDKDFKEVKRDNKGKRLVEPPQKPRYSIPVIPRIKLPQEENKQRAEDILDDILPPREIVDGKRVWVQRVSSAPVGPHEVARLKDQLEFEMLQRDAFKQGICPIRRDLYEQCFDELVRQVAITCAERGLLLARVRNEIRTTITAYQALYESSIGFGMRKSLEAASKKAELEGKVAQLERENEELESELKEKTEQYEAELKKTKEMQDEAQKKREEEICFLMKGNQDIKDQYEDIISQCMAPAAAS